MSVPVPLVLDGGPIEPADLVDVARHARPVALSPDAVRAVARGREVVDRIVAQDVAHYGVSTGFGALARTFVPAAKRAALQLALVRSHAAGTGPVVEAEVVRATMLLRLRTLATGATGVRPGTASAYGALLNAGITPVVHEYGSLGCSGDLAPLAHCAMVLIGEGRVLGPGDVPVDAAPALAAAGLTPRVLAEKEGLALINGTDGMLGMLMLAVWDLGVLLRLADVAAAMSCEALMGTDGAYAADLVAMRPHPGQQDSAANLRVLLAGSGVVASHRGPQCHRVQDAYSLRCAPQVHGAARDTLAHGAVVAARECASTVDNPVIAPDGRIASAGNFHGAPVAAVVDFLAISVADVASICERRVDRMLDRNRSEGLPPFLAGDPGVDSGFMIAQYTAAGIVAELKRLAAPASVDSIPSSGMQEDHVSMGWAGGRKLRRAVDGLRRVVAVELATAALALQWRQDLSGVAPAPGTAAAADAVRAACGGVGPDRWLAPRLEAVVEVCLDGSLLGAVEEAVGPLV